MEDRLRQRFEAMTREELKALLESADYTEEARALAAEILAARPEAPYRTPPTPPKPDDGPPPKVAFRLPATSPGRLVGAILGLAFAAVIGWAHWNEVAHGLGGWYLHSAYLGAAGVALFGGLWVGWRSSAMLLLGVLSLGAGTVGLGVLFDHFGRDGWVMPTFILGALAAAAWALAARRRARRPPSPPSG